MFHVGKMSHQSIPIWGGEVYYSSFFFHLKLNLTLIYKQF